MLREREEFKEFVKIVDTNKSNVHNIVLQIQDDSDNKGQYVLEIGIEAIDTLIDVVDIMSNLTFEEANIKAVIIHDWLLESEFAKFVNPEVSKLYENYEELERQHQ